MNATFTKGERLARVFVSRHAVALKQWRQVDTMYWLYKAERLGCWFVWEVGEC